MKRVAGYIRVSTDGQCGEDKFGLDAQRDLIVNYCEKNDMEIIRWYSDEGESGAKERPGFDEIIYGDVENPPVEAVVVAHSDRVARKIEVYYYYKVMLTKKNIELISVTEDFGEFGAFRGILEALNICFAEMERDHITKRMSGGRRQKAKRGGYAGGKAPMGYSVENGKLVINEEEAEVVRYIFHRKHNGQSMRSTVEALNENGYKTRSGKPFVISTVQSIWKNEKTYQGYYKYGKDGTWVKGEHEPIIPEYIDE